MIYDQALCFVVLTKNRNQLQYHVAFYNAAITGATTGFPKEKLNQELGKETLDGFQEYILSFNKNWIG